MHWSSLVVIALVIVLILATSMIIFMSSRHQDMYGPKSGDVKYHRSRKHTSRVNHEQKRPDESVVEPVIIDTDSLEDSDEPVSSTNLSPIQAVSQRYS